MLYHLLPVVFWLLAIGGSLVPLILILMYWVDFDGYVNYNYFYGFAVALIVLLCIFIIRRIPRHTSSVEQCFQTALLLGIASYGLPTVVFLSLPVWGYLIYQNLFSFRSFVATLIGYAVVAVWATIFIVLGWITNPWVDFFASKNALGWIPVGAFLIAYIASTIARRNLRVR